MGNSWFRTAGVLLLMAACFGLRWSKIDQDYHQRRNDSDIRDLVRSPGSDQLRAISVQHPLMFADLFWLSAVQEIGKYIEKKEPSIVRLRNWAHLATDLDPRYFQVYYGVSVNLTVYNKDPDSSDELLAKGRRNMPQRWEFPFLMGYNAYFLRADLKAASKIWEEAVYLPNVPRFVPSLAARSRFQAGDEDEAESILLTMIEHLDGQHREDALTRLKIIRSEPILRDYDDGCRRFFEDRGQMPMNAQELLMSGYVKYPPKDLFDKPIDIDEQCRARTEVIHVREDEAVKRAGSQGQDAENPSKS